jgi:hypothetical protein
LLADEAYLPISGMKRYEDIQVMSAAPFNLSMNKDRIHDEENKTDNFSMTQEGDPNYQRELEYDAELRKKALMNIIQQFKNPERRNSIFDSDRSISNCTFFEEQKYESNQRREHHRPRRRAFSFGGLDEIDEEDEFLLSEDSDESDYRDRRFDKPPPKIQRRMSFPMRVDEFKEVENPIFHEAIDDYRSTLRKDKMDN